MRSSRRSIPRRRNTRRRNTRRRNTRRRNTRRRNMKGGDDSKLEAAIDMMNRINIAKVPEGMNEKLHIEGQMKFANTMKSMTIEQFKQCTEEYVKAKKNLQSYFDIQKNKCKDDEECKRLWDDYLSSVMT